MVYLSLFFIYTGIFSSVFNWNELYYYEMNKKLFNTAKIDQYMCIYIYIYTVIFRIVCNKAYSLCFASIQAKRIKGFQVQRSPHTCSINKHSDQEEKEIIFICININALQLYNYNTDIN
jgi:hypothetical protein